jgi:hypothetical protein
MQSDHHGPSFDRKGRARHRFIWVHSRRLDSGPQGLDFQVSDGEQDDLH